MLSALRLLETFVNVRITMTTLGTKARLRPYRDEIALVALVVSVAILAHFPALFGRYVLDDHALLVDNPHLRSIRGLSTVLTSELFAASGEVRNVPYYRPLSGALYWISYQLLGVDPLLQHALNVLLHGAVAGLLCWVLLRATKGRRPVATALIVCIVFAAHPATPEIVAYVGGRQDMLGWLLLLLAWWLCLRQRLGPVLLATVGAMTCVLASLTREFFFATPLLLAPVVLLRHERRTVAVLSIASGGAVGLVAVLALRHGLRIQSFRLESFDAGEIMQAAAGILLRLLHLVVLPSDVSVDVTPYSPSVTASVLICTALSLATGTTLMKAWHAPPVAALIAFGWTCLWATVVLHIPVLLKYETLSDRYGYGVLLGAACGLVAVAQRLSSPSGVRHGVAVAVACGLVLAMIPLTWARDLEWRDESSLQQAMFQRRPYDPESRLAEGMRLFVREDWSGAYPHCKAYAEAKPESDRAGLCLGTILLQQGKPRSAAAHLEPYTFARPGSVRARVTLLEALFAANDLDAVERVLRYFGPHVESLPDMKAATQERQRRKLRATQSDRGRSNN